MRMVGAWTLQEMTVLGEVSSCSMIRISRSSISVQVLKLGKSRQVVLVEILRWSRATFKSSLYGKLQRLQKHA